MAGIFIYSERMDIAAELIGFAREVGKESGLIVFDAQTAEEVKNLGADKVYLIKGDSPLAENYAKAIAGFLKKQDAELFLVGATARGRDIAARTAGYLECAMASDISSLSYADGITRTERMMYGGAVVQSEILNGLSVVTVPAGKFEAAPAASNANTEFVVVDVESDNRVSLIEIAPIIREGVNLNLADKVVCIGLAMEKKEDMKMAQDLAEVLGAELACSRGVAEERHWMPVERYIGISGAVIKPQLYLSMGVSGQIQHVVGIREARIIVAVDVNDKAPIFKAADYGIVGDMYEIIPLLTEALRNA